MPRPLALSLTDWIVPWRERPWPVDWDAEFQRSAPLSLEIGFGNGEFLEREALRRPERNHVGIELSWTSTTHLLRRLDQGELPYVRGVLIEAELALQQLFTSGSLAEVFINHPCPWPKDRHADRRLIQPATLELLADRMVPEAPLLIVTDHPAYAAQIGETLEGQSSFGSAFGTTEVDAIPGREPTKYQRKAMAAGVPIHYFPWRRASGPSGPVPAPDRSPLDTMPSLTLHGSAPTDSLFAGFESTVYREEQAGVSIVVKLVGAYRREQADSWLVEALVKEDRLQQEFALEVARRDEKLLIKLGSLGHPRPTFGVKRAVWHLGAWLRAKHPALELTHHNLGADIANNIEEKS